VVSDSVGADYVKGTLRMGAYLAGRIESSVITRQIDKPRLEITFFHSGFESMTHGVGYMLKKNIYYQ
jgi:hypothetical protein